MEERVWRRPISTTVQHPWSEQVWPGSFRSLRRKTWRTLLPSPPFHDLSRALSLTLPFCPGCCLFTLFPPVYNGLPLTLLEEGECAVLAPLANLHSRVSCTGDPCTVVS